MNKVAIEKEIIDIAKTCGLLVEEIQFDQDIDPSALRSVILKLQNQSTQLLKLLG
jgi:hypothetical protein